VLKDNGFEPEINILNLGLVQLKITSQVDKRESNQG